MESMPYLDRVKIQIEILLPLYKRLRQEIGEQKAAAMLREAVQEFGESLGHQAAEQHAGTSLEALRAILPMFAAKDAVTMEALASDEQQLSLNVTRCQYAEFFHEIGEPEFGAILTCGVDAPMTTAIGDDLHLDRSQTIMGGGSHCDFRWHSDSHK